ncbi:mandelate racemase/muconate lactonizing enzyme family protein [Phyllobacterium sp. SB3]|uniref:mandelate racemase/muconate lactonizing enzyme family protein n=1 Tax=Phyllobacterium sp. SB3 TaxID=3156073 RepID=UPI0032AEC641
MKIQSASARLYRVPLAQPVSDAAHGIQTHFELIAVRVTDEDGVQGLGLTYTGGSGGLAIVSALEGGLLESLVGKDADLIELCWRDMWRAMHYVGQGGVVSFAISAIDVALWDIKGKRAQMPLWRLLGGHDGHVRCYAGGIDLNFSIEELLAQSEAFRENGFRAIKMKVGRPSLREDIERIEAMREELGEQFPLMVDANMAWSRMNALRAAKAFNPYGLTWLEEPVEPRDYASHASIAECGLVPIAAGENLRNFSEFKQLIDTGRIGYAEPDVTNCGGVTGFAKIARYAESHSAITTSHGLHDLSIHLLAAFPGTDFLEVHGYSLDAFLSRPLRIVDGYAEAPNTSGHGIELDWQKLERHAVQG